MGVLINVLDEYDFRGTRVLLEYNRTSDDFRGRYIVKTKRMYNSEEAARAAFKKEIPAPKKGRRKAEAS